MQKWLVRATPCIWNFGSNSPDFLSLFARSDSAVTPSEKSSINTNRKSTTRFPMNSKWTSYVVPKPPKGGSKTQGVQNLNNKLRCQLLLITDRKSHTGFWLVPTSMTWMNLNAVIALILRFSTEFGRFSINQSINLFVQKCNTHWTGHQGRTQPPLTGAHKKS